MALNAAGGLVFIAAADENTHANDKSTGKLLWEYKLPSSEYASPPTYMMNGRQYLVIASLGGGKLNTTSGDS